MSSLKRLSVIITAGGIGSRMGTDLPKQFLHLAGRPVLMHTIEAFHRYDPDAELVLTLPQDWKSFWLELVAEHDFTIFHQIVDGGKERFHSIKNALTNCTGHIIAVHDGVRPLVDLETIKRTVEAAQEFGQAIPVITVKETLRKTTSNSSKTVNRQEYVLVQTPQCFHSEIINEAYEQPYHTNFTDDASVIESLGRTIHLVQGNDANIKITTPVDMDIAEVLLSKV